MDRTLRWFALALLAVPAATAQGGPKRPDRFPIESISVEGSAAPVAGVLSMAGLKTGAMAGESDFQAAAERLRETGLFQNVAYRFGPGSHNGYVLRFELTDYATLSPARIEAPGVEAESVWKCLESRGLMLAPKSVPANERAEAFYANAIEDCLAENGRKEQITTRIFDSLDWDRPEILFRAKALPKIVGLRFEGAQAIKPQALLKALEPVATGAEYSERQFREMLQSNIVPLYDELGRLRAAFPKISAEPLGDGVVVTTVVDEGPVFRLGNVTAVGEGIDSEALLHDAGFVTGSIADWPTIRVRVGELEQPFRKQGYLAIRSTPERVFRSEGNIVDLKIVIERGAQFYFGRLQLKGLPTALEPIAASHWKLKQGAIMAEQYPMEFLKELKALPEFADMQFQLTVDPGAAQNILDVTISARQPPASTNPGTARVERD